MQAWPIAHKSLDHGLPVLSPNYKRQTFNFLTAHFSAAYSNCQGYRPVTQPSMHHARCAMTLTLTLALSLMTAHYNPDPSPNPNPDPSHAHTTGYCHPNHPTAQLTVTTPCYAVAKLSVHSSLLSGSELGTWSGLGLGLYVHGMLAFGVNMVLPCSL